MRDARSDGPRFGCPECGGERIELSMLVPHHYEIASWHDDGTPADLSDRREIDVDAKPDDPPYWCRDCHQAFQRPVRLDVDPDACPQCGSDRIDRTGIEETPYWCHDCHQAFWRPVRLEVQP